MSIPQMRVKWKREHVGDPWEIGKTLSSEPLVHVLSTLPIYSHWVLGIKMQTILGKYKSKKRGGGWRYLALCQFSPVQVMC
eukprot:13334906-Ditylum_brightwellii.AAC.1